MLPQALVTLAPSNEVSAKSSPGVDGQNRGGVLAGCPGAIDVRGLLVSLSLG